MDRKERYWLAGTLLFVIGLEALLFGAKMFRSDASLDINIHDTYIIITNDFFLFLCATLVFFCLYLVRMLQGSFKNVAVNLIFIGANISFILMLTLFISWINTIVEIPKTTELSTFGDGQVGNQGSGWGLAYSILFGIQITLIALLVLSCIKTGANLKWGKKKEIRT